MPLQKTPPTEEELKALWGEDLLAGLAALYHHRVDLQLFRTPTWRSRTASQQSTPSSDTPQTKDG